MPLIELDTLLARADVVSMNLVLNDATRGFLSAERIARMKPGVILVNTARGALVDEAALIAALKSGHIRHAGLDVFHDEPLKADHPLAKMANVTLTSHAAFRTLEASMTLLRRAIDIVKKITGRDKRVTPLIPAKAGIQSHTPELHFAALGPRFRGDDRMTLIIPRRRAAIDRDRRALDMPAFGAGQEHRQLGDVLRLADAAQAALAQRLLAHLLGRLVLRLGELLEQLHDAVGFGLAGMDDVDVDVVAVAHARSGPWRNSPSPR